MNVLVETKTEYTIQLINIIAPFINQGIQGIYNDTIKVSNSGEELRSFQVALRHIPVWNDTIITGEKNRIFAESGCAELLERLLKAVIKSTIMILTNTPPEKKHELKINFTLDFSQFLHQVYIESARVFFQDPFIYFHKCPQIEIKRNQKQAMIMIKEAIAEAIRKMLPMNLILHEYLGDSYTESATNITKKEMADVEKVMTEQDKARLTTLLDKEKKDDDVKYQLVKEKDIINIASRQDAPIAPPAAVQAGGTQPKIVTATNESTGKKMEAFKATMPSYFGKKEKREVPSVTSESYIPRNGNMTVFDTYSNAAKGTNAESPIPKKILNYDMSEELSKPVETRAIKSSEGQTNEVGKKKKIYMDNEINI
jgi:hypothetical protein